MKLNKVKFEKEILKNKFKNNQRKCAIALSITPSFLNKIIREDKNVGIKFFGGLKYYCQNNNLDFDKYIFLP